MEQVDHDVQDNDMPITPYQRNHNFGCTIRTYSLATGNGGDYASTGHSPECLDFVNIVEHPEDYVEHHDELETDNVQNFQDEGQIHDISSEPDNEAEPDNGDKKKEYTLGELEDMGFGPEDWEQPGFDPHDPKHGKRVPHVPDPADHDPADPDPASPELTPGREPGEPDHDPDTWQNDGAAVVDDNSFYYPDNVPLHDFIEHAKESLDNYIVATSFHNNDL